MTKEVINNNFTVPVWAGKPATGLHLDVVKDGKLIQKLMIDEKKCYFFGRNKESCDFQIDHQSCSRVHAALVWHKHLNRFFLIDLGSTHGTFIGNTRLEANKPQQIFTDSELKFGASTRIYIIKEKPQTSQSNNTLSSALLSSSNNSTINNEDDNDNYSLPQSEAELDNLTEFNTAHNRRISQIVTINDSTTSLDSNNKITAKKKRKTVVFNEEVQVLNPEDIDPSIGKFRNLVQTTYVIPNKKRTSNEMQMINATASNQLKRIKYNDEDGSDNSSYDHGDQNETHFNIHSFEIASKLGIRLLDLAPNVNNKQLVDLPRSIYDQHDQQRNAITDRFDDESVYEQPHKRKVYVKEAWPGRKSTMASTSSTNDSFKLF